MMYSTSQETLIAYLQIWEIPDADDIIKASHRVVCQLCQHIK